VAEEEGAGKEQDEEAQAKEYAREEEVSAWVEC